MIRLVLCLDPRPASSIGEARDAFDADIAPILTALDRLGAVVLSTVWLNRTILVDVPVDAVDAVEVLDGVMDVGPPNRPTAERA